ncbi:hypothetical protein MKW92_026867 [Papaver armeniacum]|nr:hypothetical protein MKW92_026867 [Papaver armeniacum]
MTIPLKDPKKMKVEKKSHEDLLSMKIWLLSNNWTRERKQALESMRHEIRNSTSSMTSCQNHSNFSRPHYGTLKIYFATIGGVLELKKYLADILSVLAMTMSAEGERESLRYRLVINMSRILPDKSHKNIICDFKENQDVPTEDLMDLVQQNVAFNMMHNAKIIAVDLLMEVGDLDLLVDHVDVRITKGHAYLWVTIRPDNLRYVKRLFTICNDIQHKNQFCYILARHGVHFIVRNNMKLREGYRNLARDIDVMEAKSPEDIYKTHLIDGAGLSATFVNAFVNDGFCQDKLMIPSDNKEHGKASVATSLGMIFALLGVGIVNSSVKHEYSTVRIGAIMGLGLAYAGTPNEHIYQELSRLSGFKELLGECGQHILKGETHLGPAVIGITMITMAVHAAIWRAVVPIVHSLWLLVFSRIPNPKVNVLDTLSVLSHDADSKRHLLFCVWIAQGLVHMGKGLLTLSPYHAERFLLSRRRLVGLIIMVHTCIDMKKSHSWEVPLCFCTQNYFWARNTMNG